MVDVNANAWTTLALCREHLQFQSSDTSKDEQIKSFINRALGILERYIGRQIKSREYTEYYDGDGTDQLLVNHWPIISVASLHDDPDRAFTSETLIDSTDYNIYANEGMIRLFNDEGVFVTGEQNIKLVYTAGYATIPDDLELAATILVAHFYNKSAGEGHTSLGLGGFNKSFNMAAIPDEVRFIVEPYRKRAV